LESVSTSAMSRFTGGEVEVLNASA
jgi:hypothetical protein